LLYPTVPFYAQGVCADSTGPSRSSTQALSPSFGVSFLRFHRITPLTAARAINLRDLNQADQHFATDFEISVLPADMFVRLTSTAFHKNSGKG
jgi:hypothetical protein